MTPRPVTLDDVTFEHCRELLEAGYTEFQAAVLAFVALGGAPMPRFSPLGCALELRRALRPPSEPS